MNKKLAKLAFSRYELSKSMTFEDALEILWDRKLIAKGEMAEQALVKQSYGILVKHSYNKKGSDYTDGTDSKYTEVCYYGPSAYATLGGLKNKTGTLRVMVYEPKTKKNYFFLIPHKIYAKYGVKGDSMKFWFTRDGQPRSPTNSNAVKPDLWKHKCSVMEWAE
jgi:hypothetical protein